MEYTLEKSIEILSRTPKVLTGLLSGLSDDWVKNNEGENTWSPFDVVGHLIHGEKTDWIPRLKIILEKGEKKAFEPFDRFAQFENSKGKQLDSLLAEFARLRQKNLHFLKILILDDAALDQEGCHPEFGVITVRQMLAAWTVHDLGHIVQISRVMARQYETEVGPWKKYLKVLQE